jgi:hypothetical protein
LVAAAIYAYACQQTRCPVLCLPCRRGGLWRQLPNCSHPWQGRRRRWRLVCFQRPGWRWWRRGGVRAGYQWQGWEQQQHPRGRRIRWSAWKCRHWGCFWRWSAWSPGSRHPQAAGCRWCLPYHLGPQQSLPQHQHTGPDAQVALRKGAQQHHRLSTNTQAAAGRLLSGSVVAWHSSWHCQARQSP